MYRTFWGKKCSSTIFQATIGSPTTRDSAIGSPTTRDLAIGLFEKWRSRPKLLRPEAENRKFWQDWLGGPRGLVTIEYVGNEFSFPTILENEFSFPRKRIFVSRKLKYGVDRFAPTRACDDPDTVIGRSIRENSWGQTRVGPRVISRASRMIATTSRQNALILSMPSNSGCRMALLRGGMLVIILIIPPRGYQVATTNSYDLLITCKFVCVNSHVSIRIISAWTARPHRGLFLQSRNYDFVWLIDYIRIRVWFFFFLFSFFLFSFFFFATMFALP